MKATILTNPVRTMNTCDQLQGAGPIPEGVNLPYSFALHMHGFVLPSPHLEGAMLKRTVHANGPAILFGAAREIIRAATGRGPWPAVIIPSTNFLTGLPPLEAPPTTAVEKATKKVPA